MPQLGLYTATENELGAVQRAAGEVDADLVVRSESDLDDEPAVEAFVDELTDADAVVLWLHGAEDSMPGYEMAVERLREAGVPLVVKATGDAFAFEDTSVPTSTATPSRLPRQGRVEQRRQLRALPGGAVRRRRPLVRRAGDTADGRSVSP